MNVFEKNLRLLSEFNPSLAKQMAGGSYDEDHLILSETNGYANLFIKDLKGAYYLHDPQEAFAEVKRLAEQLVLTGVDVLYVYGVGLGYFYDAIQDWLDKNPHAALVFLEDNPAVIYHFLSTEQATKILSNPQVELYDVSRAKDSRSIIRVITRDHMLRSNTLTALPSYFEHRFANFSLLSNLISFESSEQNGQSGELAAFGVYFFSNFYRNLLCLPDAYMGSFLLHQFKNIPIIICGAGPSLEKQIPLLKELRNKAIIFAPSSSMNILSYHGLIPHFGMAIDPTPETFHRQIMHRAFDTPVFYRNRIYYEALQNINGPRLFLGGTEFYRLPRWFERELDISAGTIQEEGYNVIHDALDLSRQLGCNPIIFVGLDLSFSKYTDYYSSGIEKHPLFPKGKPKENFFGQMNAPVEPINVKDVHGNEVVSYWPWINEAQWTSEYGLSHPEIEILNATEAGIGLFSIPNIPLSEVANKYLTRSFDLDALIHEKIQEAGHISITRGLVEEKIDLFRSSLERCQAVCIEAIDATTEMVEWDDDFEILFQEKLQGEIGYYYLLQQFEEFFVTLTRKDLRNLKRVQDPLEISERKIQLLTEKYRFLLQTAEINLQTIQIALKEAKKEVVTGSSGHPPCSSEINGDEKRLFYASGAVYSIRKFEDKHRKNEFTDIL